MFYNEQSLWLVGVGGAGFVSARISNLPMNYTSAEIYGKATTFSLQESVLKRNAEAVVRNFTDSLREFSTVLDGKLRN